MKHLSLLIILCSFSCSQSKTETQSQEDVSIENPIPALIVNKVTVISQNNGDPIIRDSIYNYTGAYLDLKLSERTAGGYFAQQEIKELTLEDKTSIDLEISDENGKFKVFQTPTEFLNYMDKHGYEMVSQKENPKRYYTDYTFKRTSDQ